MGKPWCGRQIAMAPICELFANSHVRKRTVSYRQVSFLPATRPIRACTTRSWMPARPGLGWLTWMDSRKRHGL